MLTHDHAVAFDLDGAGACPPGRSVHEHDRRLGVDCSGMSFSPVDLQVRTDIRVARPGVASHP
jgi:hypothetical protein